MHTTPDRETLALEQIERWARARQRTEHNAELVAYVKAHGDHRSTFETLAIAGGLSVMAVRDIWRTAFSRWNFTRKVKGLPIITNDGHSTKRARYLILTAEVNYMANRVRPDASGIIPHYTLEEAFAEIIRLDQKEIIHGHTHVG